MEYVYIPEGVCSQKMIFNIENNIINKEKAIEARKRRDKRTTRKEKGCKK